MHFGENQLSRSLIGLSPLPTAHPPGFQPWWVRSSTRSYPRFNLAMGRSLRFGSRACDYSALFGLAFATAPPHGLTSPHTTNSQAHSSKGTPSPVLGRLPRFVGTRFQVLFHSPPGVLFTFPSRYLSAIGHQGVFRLMGWSPQIHTGFHGPRATWDTSREVRSFSTTGLLPSVVTLSHGLRLTPHFVTPCRFGRTDRKVPQPRSRNACRLEHVTGLASSAFARHYSRNRGCFLFLRVMRCFTSPRSLHLPYVFRQG